MHMTWYSKHLEMYKLLYSVLNVPQFKECRHIIVYSSTSVIVLVHYVLFWRQRDVKRKIWVSRDKLYFPLHISYNASWGNNININQNKQQICSIENNTLLVHHECETTKNIKYYLKVYISLVLFLVRNVFHKPGFLLFILCMNTMKIIIKSIPNKLTVMDRSCASNL